MGEAKKQQQGRASVLLENDRCIYCGGQATTTDHCPPRCFFENNHWPEGYEFSACEPCNREAGGDEQVMGVLVGIKVHDGKSAVRKAKWEKLFTGVLNNQPQIVAEWQAGGKRNDLRRALREKFGNVGDRMRRAGYGTLTLGPLTNAVVERFMVKLGKALFYRHTRQIFDGVIYAMHISSLEEGCTPEFMEDILHLAPAVALTERNRKSLADQFIYRFNHSPQVGAVYAVVQFSEQFTFQIISVSAEMDDRLRAERELSSQALSSSGRYVCRLSADCRSRPG